MFKKSQSRFQPGFTLIELLVTAGLTMILVGGVLAAYNNFNSRQGHVQTARNVLANVERAKSRSLVGDKPESTCLSLEGYRVRMVQNTAVYTVSVRCEGSASDLETEQFTLPSGYLFQTGADVLFPPLSGNVAAQDQPVNILQSSSGQVYRFVIKTNGAIEDQGMVSP